MGYFTRQRSSGRRAWVAALSFLVMAVVACGAAAAGSAQPATWTQRKIDFTYQGFTTHYPCDGLLDKVRVVLLELGARKEGLSLHESGCIKAIGGPEPFPGVVGTFYALQPAEPGGSSSGVIAAHWQTVSVRLGRSEFVAAGECELIEQVKERILPLFNTRNVKFQTNCVPHQLTIPGAVLQVDVLKPDRNGAGKVAQAH